jgi:hypothetical protein
VLPQLQRRQLSNEALSSSNAGDKRRRELIPLLGDFQDN